MASERMTLQIDIEILDNGTSGWEREDERFTQAIEYGIKSAVGVEVLAEMCCQSISTFKRHFRAR